MYRLSMHTRSLPVPGKASSGHVTSGDVTSGHVTDITSGHVTSGTSTAWIHSKLDFVHADILLSLNKYIYYN